MLQSKSLANEHQFDPSDVWEWFSNGDAGGRITAIGLMHGDPKLRDVFVALDAIENSRSAFEQFHGMRLALEMNSELSTLQRQFVRDAIHSPRASRRFDPERKQLADVIDRELER